MHWQFLELSLPTDDIRASLDFYRGLGFTELTVGEMRPYPYTAVTDGRIAIGLHGDALPAPALSFVQAGAARWARQLEAAGFELAFRRLGEEEFHEFALSAPGGQLAVVLEAPTFSRHAMQQAPVPLTGPSSYIEMGSPDVNAAVEFWALAGLLGAEEPGAGAVELGGPALRLRVVGGHARPPLLHFPFPAERDIGTALHRVGEVVDAGGGRLRVRAPEGTTIEVRG